MEKNKPLSLRKGAEWLLGGSFNIAKVIHCYVVDYMRYPQHLTAKLQEVKHRIET